MATRLLFLFGRQFHVAGRDRYPCAHLRAVHVRGPQDAVHDRLPERPQAEIVVKVAADEAEGASAFRFAPFIDPADRVILALDLRADDRSRAGEKTELEV